MATRFLTPTATCNLTGTSSARTWGYVWFGLAAASDNAACCAFYEGSANTDNLIWTLGVASGAAHRNTGLVGPFNISSSLVMADLTGTRACALIATASPL